MRIYIYQTSSKIYKKMFRVHVKWIFQQMTLIIISCTRKGEFGRDAREISRDVL